MNNKETTYFDKLTYHYPFLLRWQRKAESIILPGTDNVPLVKIISFFIKEISRENITIRAGFVAFNFLLAIFPLVIFLFTLIPYIPLDNFTSTMFTYLREVLPSQTYKFVRSTIIDLVTRQRKGLLSLGFLLTIYFASNGMNAIIMAFNKRYHSTFHKRNFFQNRWVALKLTFVLVFLVIFSTVTIIFGNLIINTLLEWFHVKNSFTYWVVSITKWIFIVLFYLLSISSIYFYGPALRKRFRFISAGSTIASALSIITSICFAYYVNNFGQYNKLYGSLGTIMVFMIWSYLNALILIIGFELNAAIAIQRDLRILDLEDSDDGEMN